MPPKIAFRRMLDRPEATPPLGEDGRVLQNPPTVPDSAVDAKVVGSPTEADNVQAVNDQDTAERQAEFRHQMNAAKTGGRKRKSRKTRRRKSRRRHTRRH